jgi:hypothetical protein
MGQINFGQNEDNVRDFLPQYGGVDWEQAWKNRYPDETQLSAWAECFDELGEFKEQLNQTNCVFYLNDTDDAFDCVVVVDHRDDGGDWWFTREQLGEEFDSLLHAIGNEVMVVNTKYPGQHVAEYVMRTLFNDIDKLQ